MRVKHSQSPEFFVLEVSGEISVNRPPRSLREKLGYMLRRMASRLDGRRTCTIEVELCPPLPQKEVDEHIDAAFRFMRDSLIRTHKLEVEDILLSNATPKLYADLGGARSA